MGVREGLLALLDASPSHGYQLRGELETAVGELWSVNVGQVYTTLQRLERDGLVVTAGDPDEGGRQAYALTDSGRTEVVDWMRAPLLRESSVRDELVLKLLLAWRTGLVPAQDVLDAQREATMQALQGFTARRRRLGPDQLEQQLALDRLALRARAELDFLDLAEDRLALAPPPPDHPSLTTTTTGTAPDREAAR